MEQSLITQELKDLRVCILCGGNGTRLWPLSRRDKPKQFVELDGFERNSLEEAIIRGHELTQFPLLLVCNDNHLSLVERSLSNCSVEAQIVTEPTSKDTAAAVLAAVLKLSEMGKKEVNVLMLPSDHIIKGEIAQKVVLASSLATQGYYVTFGIKPNRPETGFGYLKVGKNISDDAFAVEVFVEKPKFEKAERFITDGHYYWNSGIFLINSKTFLNDIKQLDNRLYQAVFDSFPHDLIHSRTDLVHLDKRTYTKCKSISIDLSVMEKVNNIAMVPLDSYWNDIGSWDSAYREGVKDSDGNVRIGDVVALKTQNSYLLSTSRLVTTVGIKNLVVIDTRDALLVADRQDSQGIKQLVKILAQSSRPELDHSLVVYRPWGSYEVLLKSERFKVKRLEIFPGKSLSLQLHHHRSEHWVIVKGSANVVKGDKKLFLTENESVYIPVGCKHRLENPGLIPLEVIEIQTGSYLEEDDIARF